MEQMVASWSMVMVHGLMVAGLGMKPDWAGWCGPETDKARVVNGTGNPM